MDASRPPGSDRGDPRAFRTGIDLRSGGVAEGADRRIALPVVPAAEVPCRTPRIAERAAIRKPP